MIASPDRYSDRSAQRAFTNCASRGRTYPPPMLMRSGRSPLSPAISVAIFERKSASGTTVNSTSTPRASFIACQYLLDPAGFGGVPYVMDRTRIFSLPVPGLPSVAVTRRRG